MTEQERKAALSAVESVQLENMSLEESQAHYRDLAQNYDEHLSTLEITAQEGFAREFLKLNVDKNDRILDVCCGTGLAAIFLKNAGYLNIDGLDGSPEMLAIAKEKRPGLYKNIFCSFIGDGHKAEMIPDNSYDHAVMVGGLAEGHLKLDAFDEIIRMVKPGGYIVNTARDKHRQADGVYPELNGYFMKLRKEGKWELFREVVWPNYYGDDDGLTQIYKALGK